MADTMFTVAYNYLKKSTPTHKIKIHIWTIPLLNQQHIKRNHCRRNLQGGRVVPLLLVL